MLSSAPVFEKSRRPRILIVLVVSALLTALLSAGAGASRAFADEGTAGVSGTVTAAGTASTPIGGVSVDLSSEDGSVFRQTATADEGTYSFADLTAGSYTLSFHPAQGSNYLMQWWQNQSVSYPATYFPIADGQSLTGMDAALQPGASVSGAVDGADAPGLGLAGVTVSLQSVSGGFSAQAQSDASGNYTVVGLPADAYYVDFQPNDGRHIEQWWNDQPTIATAKPVVVAAAGSASGIDAHLAVGAIISGTVDAAGSPNTPLANVTVTANSADILTPLNATTDEAGHYAIAAVPDSTYTVSFQGAPGTNYGTQYWHNATTLQTATAVVIAGGGSATGIDAVLATGATIRGTVYAPGAPKVGLGNVFVEVFSADGGGPLGFAVTDANGHYRVDSLAAGSYSLQFSPQQGSNAASEWWGGTFIQTGAKTVDVAAGQTVTHVSQHLIVGSTVSGTVLDAGSPATPDANAVVVLWESDQVIGHATFPPLETATDASGNYAFPNIGPGTYTVDFSEQGPNFVGQWWSNKPTQAKATKVVVRRNQPTVGIDATLAPAVITAGTPTVAGHVRVGSTLTAKTGSWLPKSIIFTYQWLRNGVPMPGEVSTTYVPVAGDVGAVLSVAVTGEIPAFESQGLTQTVTSAPTNPVRSS